MHHMVIDSSCINLMCRDQALLEKFLTKRENSAFVVSIPGMVLDEIGAGNQDDSAHRRFSLLGKIGGLQTNEKWQKHTFLLNDTRVALQREFSRKGRMKNIPGWSFHDIKSTFFTDFDYFMGVKQHVKDQIDQDNKRRSEGFSIISTVLDEIRGKLSDEERIQHFENFRGLHRDKKLLRDLFGTNSSWKHSYSLLRKIVTKPNRYRFLKTFFNSIALTLLRCGLPNDYLERRKFVEPDINDIKDLVIGSQATYSNLFLTEDKVQRYTFNELHKRELTTLKSSSLVYFLEKMT